MSSRSVWKIGPQTARLWARSVTPCGTLSKTSGHSRTGAVRPSNHAQTISRSNASDRSSQRSTRVTANVSPFITPSPWWLNVQTMRSPDTSVCGGRSRRRRVVALALLRTRLVHVSSTRSAGASSAQRTASSTRRIDVREHAPVSSVQRSNDAPRRSRIRVARSSTGLSSA